VGGNISFTCNRSMLIAVQPSIDRKPDHGNLRHLLHIQRACSVPSLACSCNVIADDAWSPFKGYVCVLEWMKQDKQVSGRCAALVS